LPIVDYSWRGKARKAAQPKNPKICNPKIYNPLSESKNARKGTGLPIVDCRLQLARPGVKSGAAKNPKICNLKIFNLQSKNLQSPNRKSHHTPTGKARCAPV